MANKVRMFSQLRRRAALPRAEQANNFSHGSNKTERFGKIGIVRDQYCAVEVLRPGIVKHIYSKIHV